MSLPSLSFFWLNSPYNINFITSHDLRQDVALVYIRKSTPSPHLPTKSGLTWLWLVRVHMSIFEEVQRNPNYAFSLSYLFLKKSLVQISIALLWRRGNKEKGEETTQKKDRQDVQSHQKDKKADGSYAGTWFPSSGLLAQVAQLHLLAKVHKVKAFPMAGCRHLL